MRTGVVVVAVCSAIAGAVLFCARRRSGSPEARPPLRAPPSVVSAEETSGGGGSEEVELWQPSPRSSCILGKENLPGAVNVQARDGSEESRRGGQGRRHVSFLDFTCSTGLGPPCANTSVFCLLVSFARFYTLTKRRLQISVRIIGV
ncbi:hypothetical protein BSKO_05619 [Bryopsis sp. KO-2023]|nr:hypothetical protein BSKO_05619 [Bryopsis sp. KO-2023]